DVVSYRSGPANWVDARRGITLRDRDERSSLAIHVCFLRETGSSGSTTRNMEETGVLEKVNLSGFCYLALNQVPVSGEREPEVPSAMSVIANSTVLRLSSKEATLRSRSSRLDRFGGKD